CVLSDTADFQYKCTDYYDPSDESGLLWNDASLNIQWPIENPLLSEKDKLQPELAAIRNNLINGW
ncbi:dTDP-4-dehydrorhamnose 3,5-epimerase family protein, partial [Vibrio paracholerae]